MNYQVTKNQSACSFFKIMKLKGIGPSTLNKVMKSLSSSIENLKSIIENHAGINFEPTTGPNHLDSWLDSIREFRTIVNI